VGHADALVLGVALDVDHFGAAEGLAGLGERSGRQGRQDETEPGETEHGAMFAGAARSLDDERGLGGRQFVLT